MASLLRSCPLASVLALVMLTSVSCMPIKHEQLRRESIFQQTLRSYSDALKPGTTRQTVEEFLEQRNQRFLTAPDIAVVIGDEPTHWFCSERPVLLLFHFATTVNGTNVKPSASDPLQSISLTKGFAECLF